MRSRKRRVAFSAVVGVLAASALTGCVTGSDTPATPSTDATISTDAPAEAVTLDFPNFQAGEAPFSTWWDEFIAAYEEKYPNVTVNVTTAPNSGELATTLTTRFAASDPPSVVQMTTANFARFAVAGNFQPLDELLADTAVPDTWGPLQETYLWDGETLGVMTLASALVLYYNEQLLNDAGVEVPTTAEELVKAAEAVYDPGAGIYGFVGVSAPQNGKLYNESATFVVGQGGSFYDGDQPNFTDPAVIDALDYYRRAMATAPPGIDQGQRNTIFESGQGAFMVENANFTGAIAQTATAELLPFLKAAPAPFEVQPGLASVFLAIPTGIEGAELKAAQDFVVMAVSPEWQLRYAEIIGAPAPDPKSSATLAVTDPQMQMFTDLGSNAISVYPTSHIILEKLPEFNVSMFDALVEVSSTSRPIAEIMADLQSKIEAQL